MSDVVSLEKFSYVVTCSFKRHSGPQLASKLAVKSQILPVRTSVKLGFKVSSEKRLSISILHINLHREAQTSE